MAAEDYHDMAYYPPGPHFPGVDSGPSFGEYEESYGGPHVIAYDELTDVTPKQWKFLLERTRNVAKKGRTTKKSVKIRRKSPKEFTVRLEGGQFLQKTLEEMRPKIEQTLKEVLFNERFNLTPDEPPFLWKTHDRKLLHPKQMEEEHLRNAISYTQRRLAAAFGNAIWLSELTWLVRALYEFLKEAKRRGLKV
jgi:hypothetical protein